jgi:hypothetical protein
MTTAQLKQDSHGLAGSTPEKNPMVAKPLLSVRDETEYAIETDLTEEEHAHIENSVRRYHDDPSSFVFLSEAKRRMGYE